MSGAGLIRVQLRKAHSSVNRAKRGVVAFHEGARGLEASHEEARGLEASHEEARERGASQEEEIALVGIQAEGAELAQEQRDVERASVDSLISAQALSTSITKESPTLSKAV